MAHQSLSYEVSGVMAIARATGLFVSLASFSSPVTTQGPTGNPLGTYTPVTGLQNIACMDAPESIGRVSSSEKKEVPQIEAERHRHVLLDDCYPTLRDAAGLGWQVTIDGTLYDLLGAEDDSQATQTRCRLQLVTL